MQVFLSWSQPRSHAAAKLFHKWIPDVLQSVRTWMSSEDIGSGTGWNQAIRQALDESDYGIVFVTRENYEQPWLLFEAGAVAKHMETARVVPLIVDPDFDLSTLPGPLSQLQAREFNETSIQRLISDLNFACKTRLEPDRAERCFKTHWPLLAEKYAKLPEPLGDPPEVNDKILLKQIWQMMNQMQARTSRNVALGSHDSTDPDSFSFCEQRFRINLSNYCVKHCLDERAEAELMDAFMLLWRKGGVQSSATVDGPNGTVYAEITKTGNLKDDPFGDL